MSNKFRNLISYLKNHDHFTYGHRIILDPSLEGSMIPMAGIDFSVKIDKSRNGHYGYGVYLSIFQRNDLDTYGSCWFTGYKELSANYREKTLQESNYEIPCLIYHKNTSGVPFNHLYLSEEDMDEKNRDSKFFQNRKWSRRYIRIAKDSEKINNLKTGTTEKNQIKLGYVIALMFNFGWRGSYIGVSNFGCLSDRHGHYRKESWYEFDELSSCVN